MVAITIDSSDIEKFEKDLLTYAGKSFPFATRSFVDNSAFKARQIAQKIIPQKMIVRVKQSKSLAVRKSPKTLNVNLQEALVGSTHQWMANQETGITTRTRGKHGVTIPTTVATSDPNNATIRKKRIKQSFFISNIQNLRTNRIGKNRRQRNAIAIDHARRNNEQFAFLEMQRVKGIFRIYKNKRPMLVYNMNEPIVITPSSHWFEETLKMTATQMPQIYLEAILHQLRRNNLFD
jgi:hypothetical protein